MSDAYTSDGIAPYSPTPDAAAYDLTTSIWLSLATLTETEATTIAQAVLRHYRMRDAETHERAASAAWDYIDETVNTRDLLAQMFRASDLKKAFVAGYNARRI
jgi:hypothetical protein